LESLVRQCERWARGLDQEEVIAFLGRTAGEADVLLAELYGVAVQADDEDDQGEY
jgi:hypothetical protein